MRDRQQEIEAHKAFIDAINTFIASGQANRIIAGLGRFGELYLGHSVPRATTHITGYAGSLAISAEAGDGSSILFLNIDTMPDSPPAIVQPGFYNSENEPDPEGRFRRPTDRLLGIEEILALTTDLTEIMHGAGN